MDMNKAYNDVLLFNNLGGNIDKVDADSIDLQISLVFEELGEVIEQFEEDLFKGVPSDNLAKEVCDLQVVVFGLIQKLIKAGYDMEKAMDIVNNNNIDKYPEIITNADTNYAKESGYTCTFNEECNRWVFKNADGKVMKPLGYVKANVKGVAPSKVEGV